MAPLSTPGSLPARGAHGMDGRAVARHASATAKITPAGLAPPRPCQLDVWMMKHGDRPLTTSTTSALVCARALTKLASPS